ncbi:MAG: zinc-binding dehydrogenase family protein [Bradyrhizobium sp.]|nr:zinc-binding dehydrogenase family protein [Bradyrhizobium sp.]
MSIRQYRLMAPGAIDHLEIVEAEAPVPGPDEVVVRMRAASLNARDLMVVIGPSPYGARSRLIPLSDGAGEVVAVGPAVTRFGVGDRVVAAFRQQWIDGAPDASMVRSDLGGAIDGVLSEQVAFPEHGLVALPDTMSFEAAATLPCAGVTAWSALISDRVLTPDHTVLVQGTGGVALFALQIARSLGARVIATTSSAAKADRLLALGASNVIDYRASPDWEVEVLRLTHGRGVDRVVEVGGAGTLGRSFAATAHGGEIALVGLLDNPMAQISPLPVMSRMLSLRGISVGSRANLEALVAMMDTHFDPVIDSFYPFEEAKAALHRLHARRHIGKIVVRI